MPSLCSYKIDPVKGSGSNDVPAIAIVGNLPDAVSGGRYSGVKTQVLPGTVLTISKKSMSSKTSISPVTTVGDSSKIISVAVALSSP